MPVMRYWRSADRSSVPAGHLIRQIPSDQALSGGIRRIWLISGTLLLALLLAAATVVAVWRHAISDRLADAASNLSVALKESDRLSRLLRNVADAVPNGITAVDREEKVLFGNRAAFDHIGIPANEAEGMPLINLLGPGGSAPACGQRHGAGRPSRPCGTWTTTGPGRNRSVIQRIHVPLDDDGVLIVAENLTEIVVERKRGRHSLMRWSTSWSI